MMTDPTGFKFVRKAEIRLRARLLNLDDGDIAELTSEAFDRAAEADSVGNWRRSQFWVSSALLLQEEQVRRDAIYVKALDQ